MKIEGLYEEKEFQIKKKELLIEEQELRVSLTKPTTAYWESVIDQTIDFATSVMALFKDGDVFTRQMILKILGSNLILIDKKVVIQAKDAFIFLKGIENKTREENLWLEPQNVPNLPTKRTPFLREFHTVPGAGLEPARDIIPLALKAGVSTISPPRQIRLYFNINTCLDESHEDWMGSKRAAYILRVKLSTDKKRVIRYFY